jgi:hypothetical protein
MKERERERWGCEPACEERKWHGETTTNLGIVVLECVKTIQTDVDV